MGCGTCRAKNCALSRDQSPRRKKQVTAAEQIAACPLRVRYALRRLREKHSGVLKRELNTATLGLIWWLGGKQGAW